MKPISKIALGILAISAAGVAYFQIEKDDADSALVTDTALPIVPLKKKLSDAVTSQTTPPKSKTAHRVSAPNVEAPRSQNQTADVFLDDQHSSTSEEQKRKIPKTTETSQHAFTNSILNEMKFSSPADRSDFLAKNALANPDGWKQLPQLAVMQIDETLKGQYQGVIRRRDDGNWQMHFSVDGSIEGERFDGEMKIELTGEDGRPFTGGEIKGGVAHQIRASERNGVVSILLTAQGINPRQVYQLFFNKEDKSEVIGNVYLFQDGHLTIAGEVLLRRADPNSVDRSL